ncbi:hypothetical protein [Phascolarctobacterium sp.]
MRFAQLLYGKVVDIQEAESKAQLALVFDPSTYWIDITGMDCKVGYVTQFVDGYGIVFVDPLAPIEPIMPNSVDEAQNIKKLQLSKEFEKRRDMIRFIEVTPQVLAIDGSITEPAIVYGFDCAPKDIINFMAAFTPLLIAQSGSVTYKVWLDSNIKGIVELDYTEMQKAYNEVRFSQMEAYAWYESMKTTIEGCTTIEEVEAITW